MRRSWSNLRFLVLLTFLITLLIMLLPACSIIDSIPTTEETTRTVQNNVDLGVGYLKRGQLDVALEKIQNALDVRWEASDAHTVAALIYERMEKFDQADEHYQYAIEFKPRDGGVLNNYGVFLCRQKRWDEAVSKFITAVKQPNYNTPSQAYENAGACARKIPDLKSAEKYLRLALDGNPKLPTALFEMAEISYDKNNHLLVRAYLQRYQEVASHTSRSLWLGINSERKLGDQQAAAEYAKILQRNFPNSSEFKQLFEIDKSGTGS